MVVMEMWAETPVSMVYPSIQSKYSAHKSYQILHSFKDLHVAPLLATEIKNWIVVYFLMLAKMLQVNLKSLPLVYFSATCYCICSPSVGSARSYASLTFLFAIIFCNCQLQPDRSCIKLSEIPFT